MKQTVNPVHLLQKTKQNKKTTTTTTTKQSVHKQIVWAPSWQCKSVAYEKNCGFIPVIS